MRRQPFSSFLVEEPQHNKRLAWRREGLDLNQQNLQLLLQYGKSSLIFFPLRIDQRIGDHVQ